MLEKISAVNSLVNSTSKITSVKGAYDIHNISPNEMKDLVFNMYQKGEISLKDTLAFTPLDTKPLSDQLGQKVQLTHYNRVWDNPNRKRDMLAEFKSILQKQIKDNSDEKNIEITKGAIALLERLESKSSFKDILKNQIDQNEK
jgi:hypothetical protein